MDFRFTDDEREIIDEAGRALRKHLPASRFAENGRGAEGWRALAESGWLQAGLPEEMGGGGLPLVLVAAIGREAGMVLAGDGFVDNSVILPRLAVDAGDTEWCGALLEHPGFVVDSKNNMSTAEAYGVETGLAAYRVSNGQVDRIDDWTFEPSGGFGVTSGTIGFANDARRAATYRVPDDFGDILRDASIVHAATLVGLGHAAMTDTIAYVSTREQFGGPIGRFQAVKHGLAEVGTELEVAWNAVAYAALRPSTESASIACLQAKRAVDHATRAMVQFFGGIAMTWEHHAHWYVKVAQTSRNRFGSTTQHALDLADMLNAGSVA